MSAVRAKKKVSDDVRAVFLFKIPSPFFQEEVEKKKERDQPTFLLPKKENGTVLKQASPSWA